MPSEALQTGVTVALATNVARFRREMAEATRSVEGFGNSSVGVINRIQSASAAIQGASLVVGTAMAAVGTIAVRAASELETKLQNVATVWDEAGQQATGTFLSITDAGEQLLDLSTQLPQSASTLAEALYDVASSGFQGSEAMTVMTASAKAASAGLTTTEVAARGITAVLNAYGLGAGEASRVSDVLFQTVNYGVVTFEELASVMGDFVGMAATAGVSIQEANAALATMTLAGISAAEASTSLNRVMQEFIQPSEALTALLQQMGHESGVLALQQRGLHGVMTDLAKVVGTENVEAWATLFPEIRAVRGVLALLAADGQNYTDIVGKLTDETQLYGATQRALDEQSQSLSYQLTILGNTLSAITAEFGQILLPAVKAVIGIISDFAAGFQALPDIFKTAMMVMTGFIGLLVVLGGLWLSSKISIGLFSIAVGVATKALNALGVSTAFVTTTINGLKIALGGIGILLAAASAAMVIFGKNQKMTTMEANELKDTLDQQTGAITANTAAWVRDKAVKEGWLEAANAVGISSDLLTRALLGDTEAINEVNQALQEQEELLQANAAAAREDADRRGSWTRENSDAVLALEEGEKAIKKLREGVKTTTGEIEKSTDAVQENARAADVDAQAVENLTTAQQEAQKAAIERAEAHLKAMEALQNEINAVFNLSAAYDAALKEISDAEDAAADSANRTRRDRHRAERDALDDELDAEMEVVEERADIRKRALDDQHEAEREAFQRANEAYEQALSERRRIEDRAFEDSAEARKRDLRDRQKVEEDALDLVLRTQKNAFDDQLRLQRDALDEQLEELRDQTDKEIKTEKERWKARREEIEWNISQTWGEERAMWIQRLKDEEQAHEDQIDSIDEAGDKRVRTERNKFDDQARAQKQAFDDQAKAQKDALDARHQNEKDALEDDLKLIKRGIEDRRRAEDEAWDALVEFDARKIADRQRAQSEALDKELDAERTHMRDRHEERRKGLEKIQQAEDDAVDTRLRRMKDKHVPTMAELQAQIDDQLEQRRQMNADMTTIAEQGGEEVNSTTLAKLAELGPEAVAVVAASGPEAIKALVASINAGIEAEPIDPIKEKFNKWGSAVSSGLGDGFLGGLLGGLGGFAKGLLGIPETVDVTDAFLNLFRPKPTATRAEGHYAQIAPAGSWRLWAEPETGGEAYIPLAYSKRARSTSILAQTAAHFGYGLTPMADGGILGARGGAGTVNNVNVNVEARVAAGVDMDYAARVIGEKVQRGIDAALGNLGRQITVQAWRN